MAAWTARDSDSLALRGGSRDADKGTLATALGVPFQWVEPL